MQLGAPPDPPVAACEPPLPASDPPLPLLPAEPEVSPPPVVAVTTAEPEGGRSSSSFGHALNTQAVAMAPKAIRVVVGLFILLFLVSG